jgi:hypothetical protein
MAVTKKEKVERKKEGEEEECKHAQNHLILIKFGMGYPK